MSDPRDLSGVRAYPLTDGDRALIPFALGARGFRPMATGRRSSRVLSEVEKPGRCGYAAQRACGMAMRALGRRGWSVARMRDEITARGRGVYALVSIASEVLRAERARAGS